MADGDAPPVGDVEEAAVPAYVLAAGVPYVEAWLEAERAAQVLRRELRACGVDGRMVVRAEVMAAGAGVVELGWVAPEVAHRLAAVLAQAREQTTASGQVPGRAPRAA